MVVRMLQPCYNCVAHVFVKEMHFLIYDLAVKVLPASHSVASCTVVAIHVALKHSLVEVEF